MEPGHRLMPLQNNNRYTNQPSAMWNPAELPDNLMVKTVSRSWNGVRVDVSDFSIEGRVSLRLPLEEKARLGVIVEEVGRSRVEPRLRENTPCAIEHRPRDMHFTPAGMELWGYSADVRFVKDVNLSFDVEPLRERLEIVQGFSLADTPKLRFTDDRIWTLVKLLAEAVQDPDPSAQLYGDSLTMAIAARLFEQPALSPKACLGLSPQQLRGAISLLEAKLPSRVDLGTLAELAGLSQAHYSRAFKASTGLAPYQWQLQARIERAKTLLMDTSDSLEDIAVATGFADAVHLGHTFRKRTGATPAAWRADRLS